MSKSKLFKSDSQSVYPRLKPTHYTASVQRYLRAGKTARRILKRLVALIAVIWLTTLILSRFFGLGTEIFLFMSVLLFLAGFALLADFIGDLMVNAKMLDRMDVTREHVEDETLHGHSHHKPDNMETHLRHGDPYHIGNDGEIIFEKTHHHHKANHDQA